MYVLTKLRHADRKRGRELSKVVFSEGVDYIREHTDVLGEFDTLLEARQCWNALGFNPGANSHDSGWGIFRLDVARTD